MVNNMSRKIARKAWNGGSRETALRLARESIERDIAAGAERCPTCQGEQVLANGSICPQCGAAGTIKKVSAI
jgi:hypothetical protein